MRTSNALKNSIVSIIQYSINIIASFIAQAIFIRILGAEYLGLNGLFTNVLTILSIFELGIGSAIVYALYKPIANKDNETIKSIMAFYKKAYNLITIIILFVGMIIIPFLPYIVGEISVKINLYLIYLLFLGGTVSSYILVYKRNLIYANQKNYIIDIVHIGYIILLNIVQLLILYFTKNYYLYLGIKIIVQLIENVVLNVISNKMYPILLDKNIKPIDKKIEKNIFAKIKALFFHKVGSAVVLGSDNIIISSFLGVITVGLYSNYSLVVNALSSMFNKAITSITASIGNLTVTSSKNKIFDIFKKLRLANFMIASFLGCALILCMDPFITVWVGKEYILPKLVLIVIVVNFYQKMMRNSYSVFKDSMGIWEADKYIPLLESALNIIFSIILLKIFGLAGVIMGTVLSGLVLWLYSYPKLVYKNIFNGTYFNYIKETLGYILIFLFEIYICLLISQSLNVQNNFINLLLHIIISLIVPNLINIILFYKTDNFKYFIKLTKKILGIFPNLKNYTKEDDNQLNIT